MISEKSLAYFIADILNQCPTKCLSLKEIYRRVEQDWEIPIPIEWYKAIPYGDAYNRVKKTNWRGLPEEQLKSKVPTEPKWKNEVRWVKQRLKDWGWLEENGKRGIWCLSVKGQEAISNY